MNRNQGVMSNPADELSKYEYLDSIEGVQPYTGRDVEPWADKIKAVTPGVLVCGAVALAATFISQHYEAPVMLLCLLLGMVFHFMSQEGPTRRGVHFTSQTILRVGVALIGARIMLSDFTALGFGTLSLVVLATGGIILTGVILARLLRLDREQGLLIGGATAICGASAALALSAVMPPSKTLEKNTLIAVVGVTAMGTMSMVFYPVIIGFLGFADYEAGMLIGGTIHDVSQVVGAGYSISEEAGDQAIIIKLIRVFMLVPVLFLFALGFSKRSGEDAAPRRFIFPFFLIGFLVLVGGNSLHLIPDQVSGLLQNSSKWLLVMAITAVGMKTSLKVMFSLGWRPIFLILVETLVLAGVYFAALSIM
tara:strand:+ start:6952 stop:8046 length:1095 start_codon:yes stop_codon:yes gene_type:complete